MLRQVALLYSTALVLVSSYQSKGSIPILSGSLEVHAKDKNLNYDSNNPNSGPPGCTPATVTSTLYHQNTVTVYVTPSYVPQTVTTTVTAAACQSTSCMPGWTATSTLYSTFYVTQTAPHPVQTRTVTITQACNGNCNSLTTVTQPCYTGGGGYGTQTTTPTTWTTSTTTDDPYVAQPVSTVTVTHAASFIYETITQPVYITQTVIGTCNPHSTVITATSSRTITSTATVTSYITSTAVTAAVSTEYQVVVNTLTVTVTDACTATASSGNGSNGNGGNGNGSNGNGGNGNGSNGNGGNGSNGNGGNGNGSNGNGNKGNKNNNNGNGRG